VNLSHSGRLSSPDALYGAALRQAGILRLGSFSELREAAHVFAYARVCPRHGVAVLSISGGARALMADACERYGLALPPFAADTTAGLRELLPAYAIVDNPADITGAVISQPELLGQVLDVAGGGHRQPRHRRRRRNR
jgi:acyl-CoA synthetase (NDP forming)